MLPENRAKLVSKHFKMLQLLYPDKKLNFTQIAEALQSDVGNVSRYARKLQEATLIHILEEDREEDKGGRPYKVCSLTNEARQILYPQMNMESRCAAPSAAQIDLYMGMLGVESLTEDFHEFLAAKLSDVATEKADELVERNDFRELLENVAKGSSLRYEDKGDRQLMSMLANSIPRLYAQKKNEEWFRLKIYEPLFAKISNEKETPGTREWALRTVSRIARITNDPNLRDTVIQKLLKTYFEDPNDLSATAKDELSKFESDDRQTILKHALSCVDKPEKRTKAEALMKELISLSWPTNLK